MAKVGTRSQEVLDSLPAGFATALHDALVAAPDWLDYAYISGLRTYEEQRDRWARGRGGLYSPDAEIVDIKLVVTYRDGIVRLSEHQSGRAVDIAAFKGGRMVFDEYEVAIRATYIIGFLAARGIELEGGVRWGWDQSHLQLV